MTRNANDLPVEFDHLRNGYTMRGWDFTRDQIAAAINGHEMLNPAFELGTNVCPWNCGFCFTEDPTNAEGIKRRLADEMSLEERLGLIDQAAALGARSINVVGAGEPTIDPHFWQMIDRMRDHNITPIIYTEAALKLTNQEFVSRLYESGATVVVKVNSFYNEPYQNAIVAGPAGRKRPRSQNYFHDRNKAIELLIAAGFNQTTPTRLAFDTIVCRENVEEIPQLHRFARNNNIFVLFVNYLPSGRSRDPLHNALTRTEQFALFHKLAQIDAAEYNLPHRSIFPYAGGTPCTIRGLGLYVKIRGEAHDCPGELEPLGNVRHEPLARIWERARHITQSFDGGCAPREAFWAEHGQAPLKLPVVE